MTLDTLIMFVGAFVATLPFLGLPNSWDSALFFVAGVFVIALGIVVRRRGPASPVTHSREPYTAERTPASLNEHVQS